MMTKKIVQKNSFDTTNKATQKGSAIVIALFVLVLMSVFVALVLSRTASEAFAVGNEAKEGRAFYAAQGSLEMMTRNFNKKFEVNLRPTTADFDDVRNADVPGPLTTSGGGFTFDQEVLQTSVGAPVVLSGEPFGGLYAIRDTWRLRTTATDNIGVQVQLTRNILNNLVPIFQFGMFFDDDLEFHPGPRFDFGGRVHSNGSLFMQAGTGVYFSSKVSASNFIYTDVSKNGSPWSNWDDNVYIKNASGTYVQLQNNMGSVLASTVNGAPVIANPPPVIPLPTAYNSANWPANEALFDGNLTANAKKLNLPIKLNSTNRGQNLDLVEIVKRGKNIGDLWNVGNGTTASPNIAAVTNLTADDAITAAERYYSKPGIRISLADSKAKLPGCAENTGLEVPGVCGVRLDGDSGGTGTYTGGARGYQPLALQATTYQATKVNGERFNTGTTGPNAKENWIKIETVIYSPSTETYETYDITQDILALGVTQVPASSTDMSFRIADANYYANGIDSRSIVKLQRFVITGAPIVATSNYLTNVNNSYNYVSPGTVPLGSNCSNNPASTLTATGADTGTITSGFSSPYFPNGFSADSRASMRNAIINNDFVGDSPCVVPFPIKMFDTREGLYNDTSSVFNPLTSYGTSVPWAGVMSMVDIDVGNLKKFLNGDWDANMPVGTPYFAATGHVLRGSDIPQPTNTAPKAGGWVVYVSDRRGDYDFDGEYDMEDVYGANDGFLQLGEDINKNTSLQTDYTNEAPRYTGSYSSISPDIAAVFDHKYYRRGVRLINAQSLPGIYDSTTPTLSRGFTVASENGIYVLGNYNATGIASVGSPTAYTDYMPSSNSAFDIPASIASDAVTILSNNWRDSNSFISPFNRGARTATETTCRFAMLSGDTLTTLNGTPNQGGGDPKMAGGVHNFKRFLEDWGNVRLNYSGSLINLFNSHNNNAPFKCCNNVYSPPTRNWVFDATFLDTNRLPPGTPYFQYVQTTGFERTND